MYTYRLLLGAFSLLSVVGCNSDSNDLPPPPTPPTPQPTVTTIVDVAVDNGNFTTLVAALEATGLDATLADPDASFTVFAPTDDAFALLGDDTISALLEDTDTLSSILTYHVLSGEVNADTALNAAGSTVETVNGSNVALSITDGELYINQALVTATDIVTDNGIIHVIDRVITPPADSGDPVNNIVETAISAENFTTLVAALQATSLDAALADETQQFTVFAPTDDAFAMLGEETINTLLENPDILSDILLQHVVSGAVDSTTAYSLVGQEAETLSLATIPVALNTDTRALTFGGANIVTTDIYTTNGIIHVIDTVVVADVEVPAPAQNIVEIASQAGSFNTLVAALQATGLDTVLANADAEFTVFAPTDAAFELLGQDTITALLNDTEALSNILLNHVIADATILQDAAVSVAQSTSPFVTMANEQETALSLSGSTLFINQSTVSSADILAENGVIHVIDQVILPLAEKGEPTDTIADVVAGSQDFETLLAALQAADLVDVLANENVTATVFAPTDSAFDKIEDAALSALLSDQSALAGVLLQHVVTNIEINALQAYAANGGSVDTASGQDVTVDLVNYTLFEDTDSSEVAYDATNERLVGGKASALAGYTLYVFDNDLGTGGSVCNDTCAETWPPVIVSDGDASPLVGLSMIERDDGSMQAAYQGRPLYFFNGDTTPGEANGDGASGLWWAVSQPQVALRVQGANVTTTDIYTVNGVIHVIDSVITESLSN
ncbi:fasciclin domain-containing protein [Alteromonas facilis]|uniref:fasciclin domain-containing protein n=1 Tax=Alteromonas facilis TaxID=2048004 RepID=UPI000C2958ED|nr:fasciclin domain-containing protein [Alteromonas facilis]